MRQIISRFIPWLILLFSPLVLASVKEGAPDIQTRVNQFTGGPGYRSLRELESRIPHNGHTKNSPWSGDYWPLFKGQIASPYASNGELQSRKLASHLAFFQKRVKAFQLKFKQHELFEDDLADLAPSEKYDLYLGDMDFSFTRAIWNSIEVNSRGRRHALQEWEGICHGWAAASAYGKRPLFAVTIRSLDRRFNIPFFPDDLKALSTLQWANSLIQDQTIIEGNLCKSTPARDAGTGKVMTTRCKGINPGVFHLTVLTMVGEKHAPFILNIVNNGQVWNQPVYQYHYRYYNILNGAEDTLSRAALPLARAQDRFSRFRPKGTAFLVGVDMELVYSNETEPSHRSTDGDTDDDLKTMHLRYDLELDRDYRVLGGEWLHAESDHRAGSNYPGFMWRFKYDQPVAGSVVEGKIPELDSPQYVSSTLISLQKSASAFHYNRYLVNEGGEIDKPELDEHGRPVLSYREWRPQILGKVVDRLIEISQKDPDVIE